MNVNELRKERSPTADSAERRAVTKRNPEESSAEATQSAEHAWNGLDRVRKAAERDKTSRFTALFHHITPELLEEAYYKLNKKAKVGVDGVTWEAYGVGLGDKLQDLHKRLHEGRYRAKPSKRIWIDKSDGRKRPIGIASLEDKIVQQALVWILEAIYEAEFKNFSYGYRPNRTPHQALDAVYVAITQKKVSWILDADIQGFFDNISHEWMMKFLEHRIGDQRVLRLVKKFLRAGVSEEGEWSKTEVGTPQGAVISPILANIYLHYVLDLWVDNWRRKYALGEVYIVRFADDFVMGFQRYGDAGRFRNALENRLDKIWSEASPRQDPIDRIRSIRRGKPTRKRGGQAGKFRLSWFYPSLRKT